MGGPELTSGIWVTYSEGQADAISVRRCRLEVTAGPNAGRSYDLATDLIRVGSKRGNDLVLADKRVSRFHLEIRLDEGGYRLRDLESTNGTTVSGLRVNDVYVASGTTIQLGKSELIFTALDQSIQIPLHPSHDYHGIRGASVAMRRIFGHIDRIAASTATVLVTGETGVGKELIAEAVHRASPRADRDLVVVDCGAIPENLFESEMFGHERGSFTGAVSRQIGAFERAHGGTLFMDEIGELPLSQQAKLLRAVQQKQIRRVGSDKVIDCDVRIIVATNRDLALEVNRGGFREDLYYRLAVAEIHVPPLRERRDDIPSLIEHFLDEIPGGRKDALSAEVLEQMQKHYWPGNVRELRNAVERAVLLPQWAPDSNRSRPAASGPRLERIIDVGVPFKIAKRDVVDEFDRLFMTELLDAHDWNIAAAARATGVDRVSVYKLLSRLGISRS